MYTAFFSFSFLICHISDNELKPSVARRADTLCLGQIDRGRCSENAVPGSPNKGILHLFGIETAELEIFLLLLRI